ncbi:cation:proton antiporter [Ferroplasma acidiphilum]|jgi:NhaP-type Na+/H+ or K+/H+ antiporter|uniref:cation:proton antiporter n=1 Tax=Ferroplasma acidiphilum TaxID=74969 RepID=UPI0023F322EB|nr:cation:proton antiporter [Ferroplasma acidiphilum]WMT53540.1 MAG: cation:proton antiporter [Ferroplasma acidiphilum]
MIISPVTYDYYEISFILIVAAFSIPISRKASMVYIPILIVMGLIFGPLLGFIKHSFAIYMLSSFATIGVGMLGLVIILYYESHNFSPRILRKYFYKIAALDTVGMIVTAVGAGIFFSLLTGAPMIVGFIFGAIISPTDPASLIPTFKKLNIRDDISGTLIGESLFNDPLSIILLSIGIGILAPNVSYSSFFTLLTSHVGLLLGSSSFLLLEIVIPAAVGITFGFFIIYLNKYFNFESLLIALTLGIVLFEFTSLEAAGITPFPAIIATGAIVGNFSDKSIFWNRETNFNENLSFMAQSIIFILLGSILTRTQIFNYIIFGFIISLIVIFVVRPVAVFISIGLANMGKNTIKFDTRTKAFMSLVGPRGVVPVVLSTVPFVLGQANHIPLLIEYGTIIYASVSFVVLISIILQTIYVPYAGRLLLGERKH